MGFCGLLGIGVPFAIRTSASTHRQGNRMGLSHSFPWQLSTAKFRLYPTFLGRRLYVSLVRTIHGGTRCHCSYPASRSLCCFSLNGEAARDSFNFALGSNVPRPLEWEDMSWEVRLSLASFLARRFPFLLRRDAGGLPCFDLGVVEIRNLSRMAGDEFSSVFAQTITV
jgi:hypothetical protein